MKKLLILSGKGGTGKTTVASALIEHFNAEAFADCENLSSQEKSDIIAI